MHQPLNNFIQIAGKHRAPMIAGRSIGDNMAVADVASPPKMSHFVRHAKRRGKSSVANTQNENRESEAMT